MVMIVAPPGEPTASHGRSSLSTIVGLIDERGRLPGPGRFGSGTPAVSGTKLKSVSSLLSRKPQPGTVIAGAAGLLDGQRVRRDVAPLVGRDEVRRGQALARLALRRGALARRWCSCRRASRTGSAAAGPWPGRTGRQRSPAKPLLVSSRDGHAGDVADVAVAVGERGRGGLAEPVQVVGVARPRTVFGRCAARSPRMRLRISATAMPPELGTGMP